MSAPAPVAPPDLLGRLARGGPEALAPLRRARRSRNLLLLRALRDLAAPEGQGVGTEDPLAESLALLRRVQISTPAVFEATLDLPSFGAWVADTVRELQEAPRLPAGRAHAGSAAAKVARASAFAAAAAHRARLRFDIRVPATAEGVLLPGIGLLLPPGSTPGPRYGAAARARVRGDGRSSWITWTSRHGETALRLPDSRGDNRSPTPGWYGLPTLRCSSRGREWTVRLDSLDPLRAGAPLLAPRLLEHAELSYWQSQLSAAWAVLVERHPERAEEVARTVTTVVPLVDEVLTTDRRRTWRSASLSDAYGLVALTVQDGDVTALASDLVHETQHSKLSALQDLVDLVLPAPGARGYSPWRDEPRPPAALLQGVYAFLSVAGFWRAEAAFAADRGDQAAACRAQAHFARWYRGVRDAAAALDGSCWLTPSGRDLLRSLRHRLDDWASTPVTGPAAARAASAAVHHRMLWRMRHAPSPGEAGELLARAWAATGPGAVPAEVVREVVASLARSGSPLPDPVPVQSLAATRRQDGTPAEAAAWQDSRPEHWAELATAALRAGDPRALALVAFPELTRAVHAGLGRSGKALPPLVLAGFLRPVLDAYARAPRDDRAESHGPPRGLGDSTAQGGGG
ncbi:HEXXH motif-containing putative peptide modification protein [Streptomyces sp. NBC_00102]|uniref:aKG-HExxH-type peptide beta-hydroxylase n=1 Tax=Streptomyces sp. NBC_00102 TaxID=2975652 RepID=UPI00224E91D1|nr:HEXXH motif-containing putative peptide modification protein [Streptomyces sp. NBC_00102]MCX5400540.1 HEXXH motif-containing putative peptide modification protein [Streptomyces sp. NBC_00102]